MRAMRDRRGPHPGSAWTVAAVSRVLASRHDHRAVTGSTPLEPPANWNDVISAIAQHRVAHLVAPHAAALGMPESAAARLNAVRDRHIMRGLALQRDTSAVSVALDRARIEHLVVKGVVLASLVGDDPAARGRGDVDVWVRPDDAFRAAAALVDAGWQVLQADQFHALAEVGWRQRTLFWLLSETALTHPEHASVDLHWRLTPTPDEIPFDFPGALARSVEVEVAGRAIRTLGPADSLTHIAYHGRKEGWPMLRQLVDVVQLVGRCEPQRVRELVDHDPDVNFAISIGSHLAPWLADLGPVSTRSGRLTSEAWSRCLSLRTGGQVLRQVDERSAFAARQRQTAWLLRSAPTWKVRRHIVVRSLALPYALLDAAPPVVAYPRYLARKARSLLVKQAGEVRPPPE